MPTIEIRMKVIWIVAEARLKLAVSEISTQMAAAMFIAG